jgi:hypothetical protein
LTVPSKSVHQKHSIKIVPSKCLASFVLPTALFLWLMLLLAVRTECKVSWTGAVESAGIRKEDIEQSILPKAPQHGLSEPPEEELPV